MQNQSANFGPLFPSWGWPGWIRRAGPSKDTSFPPAFSLLFPGVTQVPVPWKKSRGSRRPCTDIFVAFRNAREHARDSVEIRMTRGTSSMKKMNRSVSFIHSSVPAIAVTLFASSRAILANCAFGPCPYASPSRIGLHSARKTTITNTSSSNYDFLIPETTVPGTCTRQTRA
jgi:hypothetical protein